MTFTPGADVLVRFQGIEHRGEVLHCERGWVTALLDVDPAPWLVVGVACVFRLYGK